MAPPDNVFAVGRLRMGGARSAQLTWDFGCGL